MLVDLETLHISSVCFRLPPDEGHVCRLPRLRRLVLGHDTRLISDAATWHQFFCPSTLPLLVHLALDAHVEIHAEGFEGPTLETVFQGIQSQLESVALGNQFNGRLDPTLVESLVGLPKLQHLSLNLFHRSDFDPLSCDISGLSLESLHIPFDNLPLESPLGEHVVISEESLLSPKIGRFYIYGNGRLDSQELERALFGRSDRVSWIDDSDIPPFENFVGGA